MLEVKNLCKTYKGKKGNVTKALDNVSLNFPEKGMVFILGKSGSGKSTLLNVCGGLDKADSGEIVIKGKSSREFSGQDFDSYRNTYVGFVFQEYNILDEFTVEENIGLALELQNKKRDKATIEKILSDVDMENFASRKPNTLSGGQKQRVAIARALVKQPEIIMADEPTGALDSKTGAQVFDTLKKLSAEKLVIVISHDREFAEQYADRIIELKDGKILSDQTRSQDGEEDKNVRFYGTDTVCVTNGAALTDEDLQSIKKFLNRSGGAAVISTSRTQIAQFKEDRPEMNVGSFENIKAQPVPKAYEKQKLIRSHLPVRHAVKMGANSLKSKPVRLTFTILLSVVAFILFGLASTLMLFDGKETTVQTFTDAEDKYMILSKAYYGRFTSYHGNAIEYRDGVDTKLPTKYTVDEYKELLEKYPGTVATCSVRGGLDNVRLGQYGGQYYTEGIQKAILDSDAVEMLHGRHPVAADEIAISDFVFDGIALPKTRFVGPGDKEIDIQEPADLLYTETNKVTLSIDYRGYKVVGIYKFETPSEAFDALKKAAQDNTQFAGSIDVPNKWQQYLENSLLSSMMVSEAFMEQYAESNGDSGSLYDYFTETQGDLQIGLRAWLQGNDNWGGQCYAVAVPGGNKQLALYDFSGNAVTTLAENEVALSAVQAGYAYGEAYRTYVQEIRNSYEEQERVNRIVDEAAQRYREEYLLVDTFFRAEEFENAKEIWENNLYWAKVNAEQNGETFDEQAYRQENPEPQRFDQAEWGEYLYYRGDEEYNRGYSAHIEQVRRDASTIADYEKLIEAARAAADAEFRQANPEPQCPENPTGAELDAYYKLHDEWEQSYWQFVSDAEYNADPVYKLQNLERTTLTREEILSLFTQTAALFPGADTQMGICNVYNTEFAPVTVAGIFFGDYRGGAYLSENLYITYFVAADNGDEWWSEYVSKYKAPEGAIIESVYIPYEHTTDAVRELVNRTYARAADDSSAAILNSQMTQLTLFIELADALETAFLAAGLVLALFAFLLMFNFISASITAKKKEIGILRAIGARTLDVYKIFMAEALIIALICFLLSSLGTFGLCVLINGILMQDTFIVISILSFGPLSMLCILGIALLTAVVATVIPVALYSRKPPIASIRAL